MLTELMWSNLLVLVRTLAAAFWTICSLFIIIAALFTVMWAFTCSASHVEICNINSVSSTWA